MGYDHWVIDHHPGKKKPSIPVNCHDLPIESYRKNRSFLLDEIHAFKVVQFGMAMIQAWRGVRIEVVDLTFFDVFKIDGVPSGKQPHKYGTSPFLMDKSTINGHFQ